NELTQAEMDEIITYAHNSGIQIIPLINTPGHMNAILDCIGAVGISNAAYNSSNTTVDVTNDEAVAFTQALVEKYALYFAAKGCTEFNMGADEYANDVYASGGMGFGQLVSAGQYDDFANYVNDMAAMLKSHGLTPMAFNDGIYYNSLTSNGGNKISFDTDIMIAYWSSGWSGYSVASASYLAGKGFKMINTHGSFYYVLGKGDNFDSGSSYASNWNNESFPGEITISNPAGAMFCIWCDYPGAETEDEITTNVITGGILSAMSEAIGDATPVVFPATVTCDLGTVSVTAVGLTGITCKETTGPEITGATEVKAYEVTVSTDEGQYTGSATVTITVPEDWNRVRGGVEATAYGEAVQGITGALDTTAHTFTFTAPHFSTVYVYNLGADAVEVTESKTISIVAGGTATDTISDVNFAGTYTTEDETVATVVVTGEDGQEASTVYTEASVTCNTLISSNKNNWTAVSGYYYTPDGTNYYPVYAKRSRSFDWNSWAYTYTYTWGYSTTDSSSDVTQIGTQSTTDTSTTPNITVYTKSETEAVPASTTVTFTAAADAAGKTTYVTIGNTRYTIHVVAEDLSGVSPLTVEYWITNAHVEDSDGNTELSLEAMYAYGEEGVAVSSLIPVTGIKEPRKLKYWRCRILDTSLTNDSTSGTEKQTVDTGDDDTFSGLTFTKVRYLGGNWQVYTENNEWVTVESKHQLVAYFLEILPVADEMEVLAADWGKKGDGTNIYDNDYLDPLSSCTISVQIVYE
ncbi:MAG: family 20 glycosylhydrolase, partial [Eubacteriales bacterium]